MCEVFNILNMMVFVLICCLFYHLYPFLCYPSSTDPWQTFFFVRRSPGGTPIRRRRSKGGAALLSDPAALIAEALKRKFAQHRHNNSSDKENSLDLSPFGSPETPKVCFPQTHPHLFKRIHRFLGILGGKLQIVFENQHYESFKKQQDYWCSTVSFKGVFLHITSRCLMSRWDITIINHLNLSSV